MIDALVHGSLIANQVCFSITESYFLYGWQKKGTKGTVI